MEPAVADAITGDKWNKYIFRTGRNSSQDAISNAVAVDKAGVTIVTLAQDYAFGRDGVKAFKERSRTPSWCTKNTCRKTPPTSPPVHPARGRQAQDVPGRKVVMVIWAGGRPPVQAGCRKTCPSALALTIATGGNILPAMAAATRTFPAWKAPRTTTSAFPRTP